MYELKKYTYFVTEIQSKRKCDAGHAPTAIHTRLLFSLGIDGSLTFVNPAKSFSIWLGSKLASSQKAYPLWAYSY